MTTRKKRTDGLLLHHVGQRAKTKTQRQQAQYILQAAALYLETQAECLQGLGHWQEAKALAQAAFDFRRTSVQIAPRQELLAGGGA